MVCYRYAFVGVSLNENEGLVLTCLTKELIAGKCTMPPLSGSNPSFKSPFTGDMYNQYYGFDNFTIQGCYAALVIYIVACRIAAYLALRFIKV
jgi:hypothetical protein